MKTPVFKRLLTFLPLFLTFCLMQVITFAQDNGGSSSNSVTTTTHTTTTWYTEPWVWIVGAAIFILLVIALSRGGNSSRTDKVVVSKTTDND